jgi:hypothetical protein
VQLLGCRLRILASLGILFAIFSFSVADDTPRDSRLSKQDRFDIIRHFSTEIVYIRTAFPMGEKGLKLHKGEISPSGQELRMALASFGPACKPGERALITRVAFKDKSIRFDVNGGPRRKKKWYEHISIGGAGGDAPLSPTDQDANPRGSYVELLFDGPVPTLTVDQVKTMLRPVFDFDAKSAVEAYLETVPPKVKDAIQKHQVLVGMNRDMVTYAKGKPPRKIRERDGEVEYEEWIYGEPPQDVSFIRLVGDEVSRVEVINVKGEKTIHTEREVDLAPAATDVAKKPGEAPLPVGKPTLRRPGEETPTGDPSRGNRRNPMPPVSDPPNPNDPQQAPNILPSARMPFTPVTPPAG